MLHSLSSPSFNSFTQGRFHGTLILFTAACYISPKAICFCVVGLVLLLSGKLVWMQTGGLFMAAAVHRCDEKGFFGTKGRKAVTTDDVEQRESKDEAC